jgi:hypothetical protein
MESLRSAPSAFEFISGRLYSMLAHELREKEQWHKFSVIYDCCIRWELSGMLQLKCILEYAAGVSL